MKGGDALIIAVVLFFALACWLWPAVAGQDGRELIVVWKGRVIANRQLTEQTDQVIPVKLSRGEVNIEIRKGRVRLRTTAGPVCPRGICSHTGWIANGGESIICVPNKLSISIRARSGVDALAR
ncbi:MAG TPA: NusG domain II-containing protein [Firmicutes bacterium]|jgi:hypothetical protein|nr:NusG domain II-containing protein [Bacillota bacterium]HOQ24658.1 NusG domain II-containing protein [Bacillota bacterium]HPT68170.1 NusG domain II-containing protein [Bacillota bacterium]